MPTRDVSIQFWKDATRKGKVSTMLNPVRRLALASLPLLATLTMGMGTLSAHAQAIQPQLPIGKVTPIVKTSPNKAVQFKVVHHAHHMHHSRTNKTATNKTATNKTATNKAAPMM
jgi:hypothetical protein